MGRDEQCIDVGRHLGTLAFGCLDSSQAYLLTLLIECEALKHM